MQLDVSKQAEIKLRQNRGNAIFPTKCACLSPAATIRVGETVVTPSCSVRNIGVVMDRAMTMEKHVLAVSRTCYHQLRNIGRIRRSLTTNAAKSLVHGLVTSRLDYCNALLYGTSSSLITKLQKIQNSAARIITRTHRHEHITPVLADLHWLPVRRRVEFKILVHTFKAIHNEAPLYLRDSVQQYTPRRTLRSLESLTGPLKGFYIAHSRGHFIVHST